MTDLKERQLATRVTDDEASVVERAAAADGRTVSAYIRHVIVADAKARRARIARKERAGMSRTEDR
jgi:uncharacterized protein (DUF1778 family)